MSFKPMVAPNTDPLKYPNFFKEIRYPLLGSAKYDGIRGVVKNKRVKSRTFIDLPSYQVQDEFSRYEDCDGEFIEGEATDFGVYNRTQSFIMSHAKPGDISYHVFDYCPDRFLRKPFIERLEFTKKYVDAQDDPQLYFVEHEFIENEDELLAFEQQELSKGFEGIMLRDPFGFYKCGRGTWREGLIFKLKRFTDAEGVIVDFVEAQENTNFLEADNLGYAKRSSAKEGLKPKGILGKFIVDFNGQFINVAPGVYTHAERKEIWENQDKWRHKILKFRYFAHGQKDAPRHARALGERNPIDI